MFEDYNLLQHYWWFLVSLLAALLVMLMFVQGGQSLLWTLGRTETQRRMLLNSTGRKWELTFTTLVTFGGAFFAAFPLFYSTSFGGAYWVWMLILLCFVLQAVSYEFQHRRENLLGSNTYRVFLLINGILAPILVGTAVGTFFHGAEFIVNKQQLTNIGAPTISSWANAWHGLEAVLNLWNVCLGLAIFFLSRILASLYFINNIDDDTMLQRCRKQLLWDTVPFLLFFLSFVVHLMLIDGFAVQPETGLIVMEAHKYFNNLMAMPSVLILFLLGVVAVLGGLGITLLRGSRRGIWFTGAGTVLTVLAVFLLAGWNNTAFYPSVVDLQSSLTLKNSSSSLFTLKTMTYVSFVIPFVLTYIFFAWRALDKEPITEKEMEESKDAY